MSCPITPLNVLTRVLFAALAFAAVVGGQTAATIPVPGLCNTGVVGPCDGVTGSGLQTLGSADSNWDLPLPAPAKRKPSHSQEVPPREKNI